MGDCVCFNSLSLVSFVYYFFSSPSMSSFPMKRSNCSFLLLTPPRITARRRAGASSICYILLPHNCFSNPFLYRFCLSLKNCENGMEIHFPRFVLLLVRVSQNYAPEVTRGTFFLLLQLCVCACALLLFFATV